MKWRLHFSLMRLTINPKIMYRRLSFFSDSLFVATIQTQVENIKLQFSLSHQSSTVTSAFHRLEKGIITGCTISVIFVIQTRLAGVVAVLQGYEPRGVTLKYSPSSILLYSQEP